MVAKNDSVVEVTSREFDELININNSSTDSDSSSDSKSSTHKSSKKNYKLVVVDFFAEWCMPCLITAPVVEELAEQMKEVKFVKVNIDDNSELANKNKVSSIPCLLVFKGGKEVERIIGAQSREAIEKKLRACL